MKNKRGSMTTPTKRDLLSLSDRAFRIACLYLMPALIIVGSLSFLACRGCSRSVPPEPASPSTPEPQPEPKCHYPSSIDLRHGVAVDCPSHREWCMVCSAGRCSTFNPHNCPELKP
jgi:hypothetical protein